MSYDESSDEELMLQYARGDAAAFETLYQRHRNPLYRYVLRQCSDSHMAEELYQDIWLKLIDARARYKPTAGFKTFLYHIAHNRLTDHYRRTGVRAITTSLDIDSENTPVSATTRDAQQPDTQVQHGEAINAIIARVDALPEVQRETFLLREEAGLGVDEIAEVTGVGRETVKSRLRYALQSLRGVPL